MNYIIVDSSLNYLHTDIDEVYTMFRLKLKPLLSDYYVTMQYCSVSRETYIGN